MIGRLKDLTMNRDGSQNLTVTIVEDYRESFDNLKDKEINIDIKKASKRRSQDANNYFWEICGKIAKASSKYSTDGKDDIYREAIKAKGEFDHLLVREDAVDHFIHKWNQKGTGWFAEIVDDYVKDNNDYADVMGDNTEQYKIVCVYYGSSTYDTNSMSKIIDYVVNIANDLGISTMTEKEQEKLIAAWGRKKEKHEQIDSATE